MSGARAIAALLVLAACSGDSQPPDGAGPGAHDPDEAAPDRDGAAPGRGGPDGAAPAAAGCKRGVAYGHHSPADMQALSKGISWWYNWHFEPDTGIAGVFASLGVEYVPMVWGANVATADVEQRAPSSAQTLLGFNEPNFFEQANLSAAEAAARWPGVQAVADARGLTLVSPAVNFCGGGCHDGDPFAYLDEFFAACPGCRVDALGVHVYVGCKGENGNHAQWLINHVQTYERRFSQPIWLTEFACDDAASPEEQRAFMIDAVAYLESDPRIERYAWFAGRADNVAHVDLLGADGELTALGQAYVDLPHDARCQR
ncbi:MAG: glycoside hydrolase family protein [Labilithrix sp.]|nr:glycoside hydrolase family protein [Labilithrix sp.]